MTRIEDLRSAVQAVGGFAGPLELAEILWLAHHLPGPAEPQRAEDETDPSGPAPRPGPRGPAPAPREAADEPTPATDQGAGSGPAPEPIAPAIPFVYAPPVPPSRAPSDADAGPALPTQRGWTEAATAIRVPPARGLTDRLKYQRSLRPLKRSVPTGPADVLDEEATVNHVADSMANGTAWQPLFGPSMRRWLRAVVVIDRSDSMRLWTALTQTLPRIIAETGAFPEVQTWYLDRDGRRAVVRPAGGGAARPPAELVDPSGRRTVLLISDCVGPLWANGSAAAAVRQWTRYAPVAILQPFPEALWSRTHAPTTVVRLTSPRPGAANAEFGIVRLDGMPAPTAGTVAVPVLQISPAWLNRWARFTASAVGIDAAVMFASPARQRTSEEAEPAPVPPPRAGDKRHRLIDAALMVRRFRAVASPPAARLAGYLAMTTPYLPVMRHVHGSMLSPVRPHHLAEVVLSGLMRPVDVQHGRYEFVSEEVVAELVRGVSRSESYLIERISANIDHLLDHTPGGFAAVLGGVGALRMPGLQPPFAILSPHGVERVLGRTAGGQRTRPSPPKRVMLLAAADVLAPERRAVRLLGRSDDLDALIRWATGSGAETSGLLTGPAGAGKTRLALELAEHLRSDGWTVDVVGVDDAVPQSGTAGDGHRLLVLDAVDARAADATGELRAVVTDPDTKVLLLARSAGAWWLELMPVAADRGTVTVWNLGPLTVDRTIVDAVRTDLAKAVAAAVTDTAADRTADWDSLTRRVGPADLRMGDAVLPGDLIALALLSLLAVAEAPAAADAVVDRLLDQESAYWIRTAVRQRVTTPAPLQPADCVAVAALFGAATAREARAVLARALDRPAPDDTVDRTVEWLRDVLPDPAGGYLDGPRPDRVAGRLVAQSLARAPVLVGAVIPAASPAQRARALAVLGRAADVPVVAAVVRDVVTEWPDLLTPAAATVTDLPDEGQAVFVAAIAGALSASAVAPELVRDVVTALPDHNRLFDGRPVVAIEALVAQYRRLVIFSRHFEPHLAEALGHLWPALRAAGRSDECRAIARERVEILRRLNQEQPGLYVEPYADSLMRYAKQLVRDGDLPGALRAANAAAGSFSRLIRAGADEHRARYAAALLHRADLLAQLDRRPESVSTISDSVVVYRRLVDEGQQHHRSELAAALLRQAIGRGALGDHLGASQPAADSVVIYRQLISDDRARYRPALANALLVCGLEYGDLGRAHAALTYTTEAVAIYQQLAADQPDRYLRPLSAAWELRAAQSSELGMPAEALEALAEALATDRLAPADRHPARQSRSAHLRWSYALELAGDGRIEPAEEAMREAGDAYAELARGDQGYLVLRAATLSRRADYLGQLRRQLEAIDCLTEAAAIYRGRPRFGDALVDCYQKLSTLWTVLGEAGRAREYADLAAAGPA